MLSNYIDENENYHTWVHEWLSLIKANDQRVINLIDASVGSRIGQVFAQMFRRSFSVREHYQRNEHGGLVDTNALENDQRLRQLSILEAGPNVILKNSLHYSEWQNNGDVEYWRTWLDVVKSYTVTVNGAECVLAYDIKKQVLSDARGDVEYTFGGLYAIKKSGSR